MLVLRFNVPGKNFSVMSGWNKHFKGFNQYSAEIMFHAQGHYVVPRVGIVATDTVPCGNCWVTVEDYTVSDTVPCGNCWVTVEDYTVTDTVPCGNCWVTVEDYTVTDTVPCGIVTAE